MTPVSAPGHPRPLVLIRGAGDLASGVAVRLRRCGFAVAMTDLPHPTAIRRTVSFSQAIPQGRALVEDIPAQFAPDPAAARALLQAGAIAVLADPQGSCIPALRPDAVVDAILAKKNLGTHMGLAPVVVALGPGFTAGADCHAVVETQRGHDLGRVYYHGCAQPDTGVPGEVGGYTAERILRAPCAGIFTACRAIGDLLQPGEVAGMVEGTPMRARIGGVLRGILPDGTPVAAGMKSGDIDPRAARSHCFTVSDKARAVGGGVLEALLRLGCMPAGAPQAG